jgi:hypothetical protein
MSYDLRLILNRSQSTKHRGVKDQTSALDKTIRHLTGELESALRTQDIALQTKLRNQIQLLTFSDFAV